MQPGPRWRAAAPTNRKPQSSPAARFRLAKRPKPGRSHTRNVQGVARQSGPSRKVGACSERGSSAGNISARRQVSQLRRRKRAKLPALTDCLAATRRSSVMIPWRRSGILRSVKNRESVGQQVRWRQRTPRFVRRERRPRGSRPGALRPTTSPAPRRPTAARCSTVASPSSSWFPRRTSPICSSFSRARRRIRVGRMDPPVQGDCVGGVCVGAALVQSARAAAADYPSEFAGTHGGTLPVPSGWEVGPSTQSDDVSPGLSMRTAIGCHGDGSGANEDRRAPACSEGQRLHGGRSLPLACRALTLASMAADDRVVRTAWPPPPKRTPRGRHPRTPWFVCLPSRPDSSLSFWQV